MRCLSFGEARRVSSQCCVKVHERARRDNLLVVGRLSVLTRGESLSAAADMTRTQKREEKVIYVVFLLLH